MPARPASRGVGQLRRLPPGGLGVGGNRGARSAVEPSRSRLTPAAAGLERADASGGGTRGRDRGERGTGERDGRGELSGFGKTWGWGGGVGRSEFVTPPRARRGAGLSAPARWRGGAAAGRGDVPWVKPRGPHGGPAAGLEVDCPLQVWRGTAAAAGQAVRSDVLGAGAASSVSVNLQLLATRVGHVPKLTSLDRNDYRGPGGWLSGEGCLWLLQGNSV